MKISGKRVAKAKDQHIWITFDCLRKNERPEKEIIMKLKGHNTTCSETSLE